MQPVQGSSAGVTSFSGLTGQIASSQIPNDIVTDAMIASQTTTKITTPYAKVSGLKIAVNSDSNTVTVVGATPTQVKDSEFTKDVNLPAFTTLLIVARMKTSLAGQAANLRVRHDGGVTDDLVLSTSSATSVILSGTIDITALSNGLHTLEFYADDTAGNTATLDTLEVWIV